MLLACVSVNLDSRAESLSFSSYSPDFFLMEWNSSLDWIEFSLWDKGLCPNNLYLN